MFDWARNITKTYTEFQGQSFYHPFRGAKSYGFAVSGCIDGGSVAGTIAVEYAVRFE